VFACPWELMVQVSLVGEVLAKTLTHSHTIPAAAVQVATPPPIRQMPPWSHQCFHRTGPGVIKKSKFFECVHAMLIDKSGRIHNKPDFQQTSADRGDRCKVLLLTKTFAYPRWRSVEGNSLFGWLVEQDSAKIRGVRFEPDSDYPLWVLGWRHPVFPPKPPYRPPAGHPEAPLTARYGPPYEPPYEPPYDLPL
jgi:hypothetical protein